MIKKQLAKKPVRILLLLLILLVGFYVRFVNYSTWPREGATFDEFAWPWLGISLIQEKMPMSWSPHDRYQDYVMIIYRKAPFRIVKPYLEHPPLFGLVSGGYALLSGAKNMYDADHVNPANLRKLSLFLGLVAIVALYLFTAEVYGHGVSLLAALLYAAVPSVAVGSRLLQNENFMIPVWLSSLYFLARYLKTKQKRFFILMVLLSAVMLWAKIPWLVIGVSSAVILLFERKYREIGWLLSTIAVSFGLYMLYGFYWNWPLFKSLWGLQLTRYEIGLEGILALFTLPHLTDRFLVDGWIYFGFIAMFLALRHFRKNLFIAAPFISYFLLFVWAIPGQQAQGWYKFPFYPFLIVATALVIVELYRNPSFLALIFQFLVGSSSFKLGWEPHFGIATGLFRGLVIFWSLPVALYLYFGRRFQKFYRLSFLLSFWSFLLLSFAATINYNEQ